MGQSDLAEKLEDELYNLRERLGERYFKQNALQYLTDWASNEKGWLRKFYKHGSDEPHYDLTPATEKAIAWLASLSAREFVGTESRLLTLFQLLKQIKEGTETNIDARIAELEKKRHEVDAEIKRLWDGDISLLGGTAVKERFQQFQTIARELLSDFREVEYNFRSLDRRVREDVARWDAGRGELLDRVMGERDQIADSDQGRSFRAFWDFLMSQSRQNELTALLEHALNISAIADLKPDPRLRRVHYDWLDAGEQTQRTVAQLSQQLRRFLDDSARLENKRIMEILHSVENRALDLRENQPEDKNFMQIDSASADIELPMERVLYTPSLKARIKSQARDAEDQAIDASILLSQIVIDKADIARHIRKCLQERRQVTLFELVFLRPLKYGLAELLVYFDLAASTFESTIDESVTESISWSGSDGTSREATVPRLIFVGVKKHARAAV